MDEPDLFGILDKAMGSSSVNEKIQKFTVALEIVKLCLEYNKIIFDDIEMAFIPLLDGDIDSFISIRRIIWR